MFHFVPAKDLGIQVLLFTDASSLGCLILDLLYIEQLAELRAGLGYGVRQRDLTCLTHPSCWNGLAPATAPRGSSDFPNHPQRLQICGPGRPSPATLPCPGVWGNSSGLRGAGSHPWLQAILRVLPCPLSLPSPGCPSARRGMTRLTKDGKNHSGSGEKYCPRNWEVLSLSASCCPKGAESFLGLILAPHPAISRSVQTT